MVTVTLAIAILGAITTLAAVVAIVAARLDYDGVVLAATIVMGAAGVTTLAVIVVAITYVLGGGAA